MTDESDLISKLISGDETAFKMLFDLYKSLVFNTALGFFPNRNDAEDITQDVFVQVFRSIPQFKSDSKLSTWIYRITVSKCIDQIRKNNSKKRFSIFTNLLPGKDEDDRFVNFEHPGIEAENKEMSEILFREIEKLPENQRIAFVLNKTEHLSYSEIAEIMKLTVSSVESLIFRAKTNLKKKLEKYYRS